MYSNSSPILFPHRSVTMSSSESDQVDPVEMMEEVYSHPESFGKERIAKMKVAFDSFDKDGNGVLDRDEVADLLKMHFKEHGINKQPTKADVDIFFDKLDEDKNDSIDFDEFKIFLI